MNKSKIFILIWFFYLSWIYINNITLLFFTSLLVLLFLVVLFLLFIIIKRKINYIFILILIWFFIWIIVSEINKINIDINIDKVNYIQEINKDYLIKIIWINKIDEKYTIYKTLLINENIKWEIYIKWNYKLEKWTIIKTKTKIYSIKNFDSFDYKKYMYSKWIYFKSYPYTYEKIKIEKINIIESNIIRTREYLLKNIHKLYPNEEAIFLWWILLWARESIPKELNNNFNNSWLTHFIAVSWFNITIIILFISYLIKWLNKYMRLTIISISILLFCFLVWFSAPVIRAAIMWVIWYYIIINGRKANNLAVIVLALIIMITINPYSLNYDVSLHLSFLAVLWIMYFKDWFDKILKFLPNTLEIRNAISITLAAYIFTIPIMATNFWQISIISPITNVLVAWTIPLAMLFWFLSIIFLDFIYIFWYLFWFLAYILLKWDINIVNYFWSNPNSIISVDLWIYKGLLVFIYFLVIIFIINKKQWN